MNEESPQEPESVIKVHKVKIDDHFKDDALLKVQSYVKGNGIDPAEVKLASFDGELLHFQAYTNLIVTTKISKKVIPGRMTGPVVVANEVALQENINKEYMTLFTDADSQRKIREIFLNRNDQGFGIQDEFMQIPFWKKEYVIFEPCQTCRSTGKVHCRNCGGKGILPCSRCAGTGKVFCSHCNGARTVQNAQGQRMQCPICYGQGKTGCNTCQHSGRMQCRICGTRGSTPCPNCQGHAWSSNLTIVNIEAKAKFEYPREELPDKICIMIDELGDKIKDHAKIHLMEVATNTLIENDNNEDNLSEKTEKTKVLHIPIFYEVSIPYGHFEFEIEGKSYYTFLFGIKGKLSHASPFLDDLIKNGLRKLQDAVDKRGDIAKNLFAAAEYRVIKHGVLYASRFSKQKALQKLDKDFPVGLSRTSSEIILTQSDLALKLLSEKPRRVGIAFSGLFMFAFYSGFLLSPIQKLIERKIPSAELQAAFDALILGCGIYIGTLIIQIFANKTISKILQPLLGDKKDSAYGAAKLGNSSIINIGLGILLFILTLECARALGLDIPLWYKDIHR